MSENQISAEDLAKGQESISISEFFEKNRQMLGFDSQARAAITAVKEGVDNSLDATEEAGILPDIEVIIEEEDDYYTVIIEDNGPGIVEENIPKVFGKLLYGSRFQKRVQTRGQQGIGISAAVLYSQITTGEPTVVKSKTDGQDKARLFRVIIDTESNEPEIKEKKEIEWDKERGTKIKLCMKANMRSRSRLLEYIRNTAIVNPHANIRLKEPKNTLDFERVTEEMPDKPQEIRPHPHGVDLGDLMKMMDGTDCYSVSGFLTNEFTKVGQKTAQNIIDNFKDRLYGREIMWDFSLIGDEGIEQAISESVSRKKEEEVDYYTKEILDSINDRGRVAYQGIENIVEEAASEVEKKYDTTFGETVQENTVNGVWKVIEDVKYEDLIQMINNATSKRKSADVIEAIAYNMAPSFNELGNRDRVRKSELDIIVKGASESVREYLDVSVGDTSMENMMEELWSNMATVEEDCPKIRKIKNNRGMSRKLNDSMSSTKVSRPSSKCLSPIGEELIEKGLRKEYDADFYASTTRDAGVYKGAPFIVETGIAYGGNIEKDKAELLRFANKVPLVYQEGACVMTDVTKSIGWRNYGLDQSDMSLPQDELVLLVHIASTNVPFTSESKDAVVNAPSIETEVERGIREVSRELKEYINKKESLSKKKEKRNIVTKLMPKFSEKLAQITGGDEPDYEETLSKIVKSILIVKDSNGVDIKNNLGSSEDVEIVVESEGEISSSNLEKDEKGVYKWSGKVDNSEEQSIEYDVDMEEDFEVRGVEKEKYDIIDKR